MGRLVVRYIPTPPGSRARRPTIAARLAMIWSVGLLLFGALVLAALPPLTRAMESGYCGNIDHPAPCTSLAEMVAPGLVLLTAGAWCLVGSIGLGLRLRWARWAVAGTFTLLGAGTFGALLAVAGAPGGPNPGALVFWFVLLSYFVITAVLTVTQRPEA